MDVVKFVKTNKWMILLAIIAVVIVYNMKSFNKPIGMGKIIKSDDKKPGVKFVNQCYIPNADMSVNNGIVTMVISNNLVCPVYVPIVGVTIFILGGSIFPSNGINPFNNTVQVTQDYANTSFTVVEGPYGYTSNTIITFPLSYFNVKVPGKYELFVAPTYIREDGTGGVSLPNDFAFTI
jgi:hypothetical protein